jgi:hypothetical protein
MERVSYVLFLFLATRAIKGVISDTYDEPGAVMQTMEYQWLMKVQPLKNHFKMARRVPAGP